MARAALRKLLLSRMTLEERVAKVREAAGVGGEGPGEGGKSRFGSDATDAEVSTLFLRKSVKLNLAGEVMCHSLTAVRCECIPFRF